MKGVSQKQVAKLLGIKDRTWIYRWESGYILPSLVNAGRLSLLYEAKIEVLFPGLPALLQSEKWSIRASEGHLRLESAGQPNESS